MDNSTRTTDKLLDELDALRARVAELEHQVAARNQWKTVLEHANWGIAIGRTTLDLMNPAFAHERGYAVRELIGRPIADLFAPECRDKIPAYIAQSDEKGHHIFESIHIRKDGSTFPVRIDVTAVKDDAGEVLYRVMNAQDITEQKQAEEDLRVSEEKWRTLVETIPDVVVMIDRAGTLQFINHSVTGIDPNQVIGMNFFDFVRDEYQEVARAHLEQVFETGQPTQYETLGPRGAAVPRWFITRLGPVKQGDQVVAVTVIATDISDQKRVEELLHRRLEFERLIGSISARFINRPLGEIDQEIDHVLKVIAQYAGAVGSSVFLFSDDLSTVSNTHEWCANPADSQIALMRSIPFEQFESYNTTLKRQEPVIICCPEDLPGAPTGEREWAAKHGFRALLFVPMISEGQLRGALGFYGTVGEEHVWAHELVDLLRFAADILINAIERKRAEEELRKHREDLETLVAERTAELQNVNEHLKVLSLAKDEFVANVSHELRTPIMNLKLRQYILAREPEALGVHLAVLRRETDRLGTLIDGLLTLSRLDLSPTQFCLTELDLSTLIWEYVEDRRSLADQKGLTLSFEDLLDLPPVPVDPDLIGQAMSILLTNALNYTPAGGRVVVRMIRGEDWVGFSVSDTGPGIPAEDKTALFARFARGSVGKESGVSGTGLGLAIAKAIADRHNGWIDVESSDEGAVFRVRLPLVQDDQI